MENDKILIIDDESSLREVYSEYLKESGFTNVVEKNDGLDAFVFCSLEKVDLILLDHRMPFLHGSDFLKALRSKKGPNKNTPVIMISGYVADFKESVESLEKVFFLEKPVSMDTLLRYVKMALYGEALEG